MCGIVSYIGKKDPVPILLKGLRRLEYRGYDSSGIALLNTHKHIFPISCLVILQMLVFELAVYRGCEIDQPRNLAKSVTVE